MLKAEGRPLKVKKGGSRKLSGSNWWWYGNPESVGLYHVDKSRSKRTKKRTK